MEQAGKPSQRGTFDFTRVIPHLSRTSEVQRLIVEKAGFSHFHFALRSPLPVSFPVVYVLDNFSDAARRAYDEGRSWQDDPVLNYSGGKDTLIWREELPRHRRIPLLWRDASDEGLSYWFIFKGGVTAILSLTRGALPLSGQLAEDLRPLAYQACRTLLDIVARERKSDFPLLPREKLSSRELHILRLSADGMTAEEIAHQVFISKSTVNFHIKRINRKLCSRNKSQAIAKAALMSLL
ncbi:LuxR C-terminal-related transcriptional regulator [Pseudomonas sp. RIT-PI-AD]|uniref:LuxR C-terminal-related transcriptional regulator n=1 Tax=Pseudomonas sp. RIT-PI-AD TaxID=3035294 RepID=UPI0021DB58F0|nr:LuxR C-terminal-related transcriptional regulator [Pseudomonas sp. RIT-PI-AD]